jgi:hypothetical protein
MSGASREPSSPTDGPKKRRRKRSSGPRVDGGSREARKVAMLILEVLGGQRTPSQAATALGVSTTRYYGLESQALEGLVGACEPKNRGPRRSLERQVERLEREVARLQKECARRQSVLRMSHRALGLSAPSRGDKESEGSAAGPNKKRKRKPKRASARALRAAAQLVEPPAADLPTGDRSDTSG